MKYILSFILAFSLLFTIPDSVRAGVPVVSPSAQLKVSIQKYPQFDFRAEKLKKFLASYNSPLVPYTESFIEKADYYNLDWRLVASITGVESTFGKRIPLNSFNAYGWSNGDYRFKSWEESIEIVSKSLRIKYYDRGATNITKIARRYAPPSNSWGWKVKFFMEKIDPTPIEFDL